MALSEKEARYVAELAHLELTDEELKIFIPQLDSVLAYMEKLKQLDTNGVNPMAQVTYPTEENSSIRIDQSHKTFDSKEALQNAPEQGPGYFKVPQVIERK